MEGGCGRGWVGTGAGAGGEGGGQSGSLVPAEVAVVVVVVVHVTRTGVRRLLFLRLLLLLLLLVLVLMWLLNSSRRHRQSGLMGCVGRLATVPASLGGRVGGRHCVYFKRVFFGETRLVGEIMEVRRVTHWGLF